MSKIYQFPQGKEKQKLKREFAKNQKSAYSSQTQNVSNESDGKTVLWDSFHSSGICRLEFVTCCDSL